MPRPLRCSASWLDEGKVLAEEQGCVRRLVALAQVPLEGEAEAAALFARREVLAVLAAEAQRVAQAFLAKLRGLGNLHPRSLTLSALLGEGPQHVVQNPAVLEVFELDGRIDPGEHLEALLSSLHLDPRARLQGIQAFEVKELFAA